MDPPGIYGRPPFTIAVLHGGPGAAGEMAPVARRLAMARGVLEPFQSATSVDGQVDELGRTLRQYGRPPLTVIGFSWGAWLGLLLAAARPDLVEKLILIGCAPLEASQALRIETVRLSRLTESERTEFHRLQQAWLDPGFKDRNALLARLGALFSKADACDPLPGPAESVKLRADIFASVWSEAAALRTSGRMLERVARVACPVRAIHGDFDPHPAEAVRETLSRLVPDFRFHLLKQCGHRPWIERLAREPFFQILDNELADAGA